MDHKVLEAVKVLMGVVSAGELVRFRLTLAGQVVLAGREPEAATLIVFNPLVTSTAEATVSGLGAGDRGLS